MSDGAPVTSLLPQLVRYGAVGVAANAAAYLVFLLLTHWGIGHKMAMTMLYLLGATLGFLGNRSWTFGDGGSISGSVVRYACAHAAGYGINLAMLVVLSDQLGYPYQLVQIISVLVVAAFLFLAFKFVVFRSCSEAGSRM